MLPPTGTSVSFSQNKNTKIKRTPVFLPSVLGIFINTLDRLIQLKILAVLCSCSDSDVHQRLSGGV